MKSLKTIWLLAAACLITATAAAQSGNRERSVGDRIGSAIERAVNSITHQPWWSDEQEEFEQDTTTVRKAKSVDMDDLESQPNTKTYSSATTVGDTEVVKGSIVVKGANLTVAGTVDGDVLVVGGTLTVKQRGVITGNARVINGDIIKEEGASIKGYEDRTGSAGARYREPRKRFAERGTTFNVPWLPEQTNLDNVIFRYNRVEGIFLGLGSDKKFYWDGQKRWSAYGSVGYGFKAHKWRGNIGLARQFPVAVLDGRQLLELGVEGYSLTDSRDQWLISATENTLSALVIHEDFRDYFQREGFTVHGSYFIMQDEAKAELSLAYLVDRYASLLNRVDWALFGGDKVFRLNPPITPGQMRSILFSGGFNTVSRTSAGPEGWNILASSEIAKRSFSSDFDFDRYEIDVRRFQPLGQFESMNIRLRIGTAGGAIPLQKAFDLGGLGTTNAFPFKSETGNRMILCNAEFIMNGNILEDLDFWPSWLFRHFNFLLLSDAGLIRSVAPAASATEGFNHIHWNEFRHDFGFGFANRSGSFRIGITWRTDRAEPVRFLFRIYRPF
jgi:hypothetical protein